MYRYIVYLKAFGYLSEIDPATDLLLADNSFLCWRHIDQKTVADSWPFCGTERLRNGHWMIYPISRRFVCPDDCPEDRLRLWLENQLDRSGHVNLGMHEASRYKSLFMPLSTSNDVGDLMARVNLMTDFMEERGLGNALQAIRQIDELAPMERWPTVQNWFIDKALKNYPSATV